MIEVEQAIELIETNAAASETERSDIKKALGYVSMQNVLSPINSLNDSLVSMNIGVFKISK